MPPVLLALIALAAVVFFILDGLNVRGPRFNPCGFGLACTVLVVLWPAIHSLST
jgi:hypothetical protein